MSERERASERREWQWERYDIRCCTSRAIWPRSGDTVPCRMAGVKIGKEGGGHHTRTQAACHLAEAAMSRNEDPSLRKVKCGAVCERHTGSLSRYRLVLKPHAHRTPEDHAGSLGRFCVDSYRRGVLHLSSLCSFPRKKAARATGIPRSYETTLS